MGANENIFIFMYISTDVLNEFVFIGWGIIFCFADQFMIRTIMRNLDTLIGFSSSCVITDNSIIITVRVFFNEKARYIQVTESNGISNTHIHLVKSAYYFFAF